MHAACGMCDVAALEYLARRQVGHSLLICTYGESCNLEAARKRRDGVCGGGGGESVTGGNGGKSVVSERQRKTVDRRVASYTATAAHTS